MGGNKVALARSYAEVVFKNYDYDSVVCIVELIDKYGEKQVAEAFRIVAQKAVDNPKRKLAYVIGVLRRQSSVGE